MRSSKTTVSRNRFLDQQPAAVPQLPAANFDDIRNFIDQQERVGHPDNSSSRRLSASTFNDTLPGDCWGMFPVQFAQPIQLPPSPMAEGEPTVNAEKYVSKRLRRRPKEAYSTAAPTVAAISKRSRKVQVKEMKQDKPSKVARITSRFIGVHWHNGAHKWVAQISIDSARTHLGYFKTEVEAARTYDKRAASLGRPVNTYMFEHNPKESPTTVKKNCVIVGSNAGYTKGPYKQSKPLIKKRRASSSHDEDGEFLPKKSTRSALSKENKAANNQNGAAIASKRILLSRQAKDKEADPRPNLNKDRMPSRRSTMKVVCNTSTSSSSKQVRGTNTPALMNEEDPFMNSSLLMALAETAEAHGKMQPYSAHHVLSEGPSTMV